ncbi:unnamed protein product [Prorocentrum cordatum]|uniref:Uncharacterized protein n=1 Tax=Prorocentrum cordatum TaxID=2364126 RepID=A0ABN9UP48_9DINO|nr:unnamed protein product [Polarella glacialis]
MASGRLRATALGHGPAPSRAPGGTLCVHLSQLDGGADRDLAAQGPWHKERYSSGAVCTPSTFGVCRHMLLRVGLASVPVELRMCLCLFDLSELLKKKTSEMMTTEITVDLEVAPLMTDEAEVGIPIVDVQSLPPGTDIVVMTSGAEAGLTPGDFGEQLSGRGAAQVMGIPSVLQLLSLAAPRFPFNSDAVGFIPLGADTRADTVLHEPGVEKLVMILVLGRAVLELVLMYFGVVFMRILIVG